VPGPARIRYTHQAMADMLIAEPSISQDALAATFGFTPGWVSQVVNSDGFQAYLESRREELIDPSIKLTIDERLRALAVQSTEILADSLALTRSPDLALQALNTSARALGYGAKQQNVNVEAHFVVALPEKAATSAEWAERVASEPRPAITVA